MQCVATWRGCWCWRIARNVFWRFYWTRNPRQLRAEVDLWKQKWLLASADGNFAAPATCAEALQACEKDCFPIVHNLLIILLSLPVSVATAERSFSTLRRVKTWIRSREWGRNVWPVLLCWISTVTYLLTQSRLLRDLLREKIGCWILCFDKSARHCYA